MIDLNFIIQLFTGLLIAIGGFVLRGVFSSLTQHDKRINKLEVDMARNTAENESLFKRLDNIEGKLDKLLDWKK